jgi:hypothetical protein
MSERYKLVYTLCNDNVDSKDYKRLINKVVEFNSFREAVQYSQFIVNTHINLLGQPVIDLTLTEKVK